MQPNIRSILANHSLRTTQPRLAVFAVLKKAPKPLTSVEIVKACPAMDKVSVYRTIDTFKKIGIIETVVHGWKQRHELATPFRPHHHHLVCTHCGAVTEIHSEDLEQTIQRISDKSGFTTTGHSFEISGICTTCRSRNEQYS